MYAAKNHTHSQSDITGLTEAITNATTNKQDKTDNSLQTTAKTIVGAINELFNRIAEALSFADKVVLVDIYAARETDTLGISSRTLCDKIVELGHECTYFPTLDGFSEVEKFLLQNCTKGDLLITMGAGDVVKIGNELLGH